MSLSTLKRPRMSTLDPSPVEMDRWARPAFGSGKCAPLESKVQRANRDDADSTGILDVNERLESKVQRANRVDDVRWLEDLTRSGDRGLDDAIISALDRMDELLEAGDDVRRAAILGAADPDRLPIEVSLALLAGTAPARKGIEGSRVRFLNRLEQRIERDTPGEAAPLLRGLR